MTGLSVVPQEGLTPLERLARDFLAHCRARNLSPRTINQVYRPRLERIFLPWCRREGITEASAITQRVLDRFSSELLEKGGERKAKLSPDSVGSYLHSVNTFLKWCEKEGEAVAAKAATPKTPRRILPVLSREEIDRMERTAGHERDKLIVRVLADTGLRVGELVSLTVGDLIERDRTDCLLVNGKGARQRLVPLMPELAKRLRRFVRTRSADATSDRLFLGQRRAPRTGEYRPLTESGVEQLIRGLGEQAGIGRRIYPHLLRHSFATYMLRRDKDGRRRMDSTELRQVLGHSSTTMLDRHYSNLLDSDIAESVLRALRGG
jgi:site-specific recombinase XerD